MAVLSDLQRGRMRLEELPRSGGVGFAGAQTADRQAQHDHPVQARVRHIHVARLIHRFEQPLVEGVDILGRYPGVDGSAYVIGGVGMTVTKRGNVVVVPIRSGVGARLGINVGYLNFTSEPTWNPF